MSEPQLPSGLPNGEANFTPTQQRILMVLADGLRHTKEELFPCLYDELGSIENVKDHISRMRKKLQPRGEDILCEVYYNRLYYRHVRLLANPYRG